MSATAAPTPELLVTYAAAGDLLGLGVRTIERMVRRDPDFPKPVRVGARGVRLRRADVVRWAEARPAVPAPA